MNWRLYVGLLGLLTVISCAENGKQFPHARPGNQAKSAGLLGAVEEVQERNFARPEGNSTVSMDSLAFLGVEDVFINWRYDKNGVLLERKYSVEGRFGNWVQYQYDANLRKTGEFDQQEDGAPRTIGEYQYGENGLMKESQTFVANGKMKQRLRYRYDRKGRLKYLGAMFVDETEDPDGKKKQTEEHYYYAGPDLRVEIHTFQNQLRLKRLYAKGKLIQEHHYDSEGQFNFRILHQYNTARALVTKKKLNAQGEILDLTEYQYDQSGRKIEEALYDKGDVLMHLKVYRYDSLDNVVLLKSFGSMFDTGRETGLDPNGVPDFVSKYKYSYDAQGNWTRKEHYTKENYPVMLTLRKITYHAD